MFENLTKFFKKFNKKDDKANANSKDAAKERLHLVLMQDRANVSADFLELMKQEIIEVIKKYIDVDEEAIDVRLTNKENEDGTNGAPALYANIPILNIKNEARKVDSKEIEKNEKEEKKDESKEVKEESKKEKIEKQVVEQKKEKAGEIKKENKEVNKKDNNKESEKGNKEVNRKDNNKENEEENKKERKKVIKDEDKKEEEQKDKEKVDVHDENAKEEIKSKK